jgi:hypothetical protein
MSGLQPILRQMSRDTLLAEIYSMEEEERMNWDAIGAGAEMLAAIGGVAAVFYLAFQIRLNTRVVRSASIDSWVTAVAYGNEAMASADEFISQANENYDELDDHQRRIYHRALAQMYNALEALYFHHANGVIDVQFLETKMKALAYSHQYPGVRKWWSVRGIAIFDPRFVKYVDNMVQER